MLDVVASTLRRRMGLALLSVAVSAALWAYRRSTPSVVVPATQAHRLLTRAAPLLRLPGAPDRVPEVLPDGSGLRCPATRRVYPYRAGILDLLDEETPLTITQHTLNTPLSAWAYDRFRNLLVRLAGAPDFQEDAARTQQALGLQPGDTVLDLACGHGNFSVEWARRVGPEGFVIGLDIAPPMLARAATRVQAAELDNVLLIRGDAHRLPFADTSLMRVNCSGGFHQLPDLPRALREIARVSQPGAVLTASTFAEEPQDPQTNLKHWCKTRFDLHFVPLPWLGEQLAAIGYTDYRWSLPGGWFGYTSARKAATQAVQGAPASPLRARVL